MQADRPMLDDPPSSGYLVRILGALGSFELLFLLYMWAGRYKAIPAFTSFPIDLTLFFFLMSIGVGGLVAFNKVDVFKSIRDQGLAIYLLFLLWILISYIWSSNLDANREKLINTMTLLTWSFLGPYVIISSSIHRVRRFMMLLMIFCIGMILYWYYVRYVLGIDLGVTDAPEVGPDYLGYGEHALCLFFGFFALFLMKRGIIQSILSFFAMAIVLVVILLIGGKGPLLMALLIPAVSLIFVFLGRKVAHAGAKVFYLAFAIIVIMFFLYSAISIINYELVEVILSELTTLDRILSSLGRSDFGGSATSRIEGQEFAVLRWLEAPFFGNGIGEFTVLRSVLQYPHNLALELLMELGLVGFSLFLGIFVLGLFRTWRIWPQDPTDWTIVALCMIFMAMLISRVTFQGFLPDERLLFAVLGLVLGLGRELKNSDQKRAPRPRNRHYAPSADLVRS